MISNNEDYITNSRGLKIRKINLQYVISNENFYPFLRPKVRPLMTNAETQYYNTDKK